MHQIQIRKKLFQITSSAETICQVLQENRQQDFDCSNPPEYFGDGHKLTCGHPMIKYTSVRCKLPVLGYHQSILEIPMNISLLLGN